MLTGSIKDCDTLIIGISQEYPMFISGKSHEYLRYIWGTSHAYLPCISVIFLNFFVRPILKKNAFFALAAGIKMPCQNPLDTPKPFFLVGGVELLLTKAKKRHNFFFLLKLISYLYHHKGPKMSPPPDPPNPFFQCK